MIVGTGIDLVEVERIARGLKRFGDRFLHRLYTAWEVRYCTRSRRTDLTHQRLAARFAAKEAVMKALGTGTRGVGWRDIEVRNAPSGRPEIHLSGRGAGVAHRQGIGRVEISLTHTREHAMAQAIALSSGGGRDEGPHDAAVERSKR